MWAKMIENKRRIDGEEDQQQSQQIWANRHENCKINYVSYKKIRVAIAIVLQLKLIELEDDHRCAILFLLYQLIDL